MVDLQGNCHNCPVNSHCFLDQTCGTSCIRWTQTEVLMYKNNLQHTNTALSMTEATKQKYLTILHKCTNRIACYIDSVNPAVTADALTYLSICEKWEGNITKSRTYSIKFSHYVELLQKSWGGSSSPEVYEIEEGIQTAEVLIISGLDYINFKDFQAQRLLMLLDNRDSYGKTTILVLRSKAFIGDSAFLPQLTMKLNGCEVK